VKPVTLTCPKFKGLAYIADAETVVRDTDGKWHCPAAKIHTLEATSARIKWKLIEAERHVMREDDPWTANDIGEQLDPWGTVKAAIRLANVAFPVPEPDGHTFDGTPAIGFCRTPKPTDLLDWKIVNFGTNGIVVESCGRTGLSFCHGAPRRTRGALARVDAFKRRCTRKLGLKIPLLVSREKMGQTLIAKCSIAIDDS
jgi:hypothetical protein